MCEGTGAQSGSGFSGMEMSHGWMLMYWEVKGLHLVYVTHCLLTEVRESWTILT